MLCLHRSAVTMLENATLVRVAIHTKWRHSLWSVTTEIDQGTHPGLSQW